MILSEKEIYLQETEIKPNLYARLVILCCFLIVILCWVITEVGIFRVGKVEMRINTALTAIATLIPLCLLYFDKKALSDSRTKYLVVLASAFFTFSVGTFITFHTTIMMIFPIFFSMLYRSKKLGIIGAIASFTSTVFGPILGYVLGTWDIELFKELILIGTNGTTVIENAYEGLSWLNVGKIVLYLVFPRVLMIGSCSVLMFRVIRISADHVEKQIQLNKLHQRDNLTGLFNQSTFKEFAADVKKQQNITASVLFFDVNGLKKANDQHGHELGDLMLSECAKSILNVCDENTSYGFRLGGDEFVILLLDSTEEKVQNKISEWRESLRKINEEHAENRSSVESLNNVTLEISMAVGSASGSLFDIEELVKQADNDMYHDKKRYKEEQIY